MHRRNRHLNPAQAGAQIALDARFITGQADNTTLETWTSRPVAALNATQATSGQRPTYRNPSINGQPALVFDGSDDSLEFSGSALALTNGATGITALCVCQSTSVVDAIQYPFFTSNGLSATANRFSIRTVDTSIQRTTASVRRTDADTNVVTTTAGSSANPIIAAISSDYAGGSASCSVNGGTPTTVAFSSGGGVGPATNALNMRVGAVNSTTGRLTGRVAALVVITPNPSASLVKRIRHHLAFSFKIASA